MTPFSQLARFTLLLAALAVPGAGAWERVVAPDTPDGIASALTELAEARRSPGHASTLAVIRLRSGTHTLSAPLRITSAHGPVRLEPAEPGRVVVRGGPPLEALPGGESGPRRFRLPPGAQPEVVWLGDRRAVRARHPNQGFFLLQGNTQSKREAGGFRQEARLRPEDLTWATSLAPEEIEAVRVTVLHKWDFTRRHLRGARPAEGLIISEGKELPHWNPWAAKCRVWFEDAAAFLDAEGEWRIEGEELHVVWPAGLPPDTPVYAPSVPTWLEIAGEPAAPVRAVTVRGLTFAWAGAAALPHDPFQSSVDTPAALRVRHAAQVRLEDLEILHTGGHGVRLEEGTQEVQVTGCRLEDLGAGGIYIGLTSGPASPTHPCGGHRVEDNRITRGGRHFASGCGLLIGHSADNRIAHNLISDFYYTGISVGWVWGYADSVAKRNHIVGNRVSHIGQGLLSDMGGIYTLGRSEGTVVERNRFEHIRADHYGGWGLYTDEGSTGIVFRENLVVDADTGGFHQHYGRENVITNNVFISSQRYQLQFTRPEPHLSFTFAGNLLYWTGGELLHGGAWKEGRMILASNLYWRVGGGVRFRDQDLAGWQASGRDAGSIVADPLFVDAGAGNFDLRPDSPALALGFRPWDWRATGPRTRWDRPGWDAPPDAPDAHPQAPFSP
jgi:hypothetical protein